MRYELININKNNYQSDNLKKEILENREVKDINGYCNPTSKYENHFSMLKNIDIAVKCLIKHIENNDKINVIFDEDTDGFTSSAILIGYLRKAFKNININYILHTRRKAHGISNDIIIPDDTKLLIVPDAGSNDIEKHKELHDKGIDIIILDHHEVDVETNPEHAIIVNNQMCDYPNKHLCGVGVVYKFLQALDEELWLNYSNDFIDMVALGLIGDNMDVRNLETKYYIDQGLNNIKNKQIKALIQKQEYKIHNIINMVNVSFYITPLINAMIRIGKQEEKLLMVKGFLEEYMEFDYKPRGKDELIKENIYNRVARLATNTKTRQDKLRDKALTNIVDVINKRNKTKDKILAINCTNICDSSITGVVAIKVASKYNKPCLLLKQNKYDNDIYGGSGRNTNKNEVTNLKQFLNDSKLFKFAQGHPSAFGLSIHKENIPKFIQYSNDKLKDIEFDSNLYKVDFIIPFENLNDEIVYEIDFAKNLWGKGVDEPLIAIENIEVKASEIQVIGKTSNTLKFNIDGVDFIKFYINEDEEILKECSSWDDNSDKTFLIDVVGKCSANVFNSEKNPQIIIEDYRFKIL